MEAMASLLKTVARDEFIDKFKVKRNGATVVTVAACRLNGRHGPPIADVRTTASTPPRGATLERFQGPGATSRQRRNGSRARAPCVRDRCGNWPRRENQMPPGTDARQRPNPANRDFLRVATHDGDVPMTKRRRQGRRGVIRLRWRHDRNEPGRQTPRHDFAKARYRLVVLISNDRDAPIWCVAGDLQSIDEARHAWPRR